MWPKLQCEGHTPQLLFNGLVPSCINGQSCFTGDRTPHHSPVQHLNLFPVALIQWTLRDSPGKECQPDIYWFPLIVSLTHSIYIFVSGNSIKHFTICSVKSEFYGAEVISTYIWAFDTYRKIHGHITWLTWMQLIPIKEYERMLTVRVMLP